MHKYKIASGQHVNVDKLTLLFSSNIPTTLRGYIMEFFWEFIGYCKGINIWVFLLWWGKLKQRVFQAMKERIWQRLQGWLDKLLSYAGKAVLIQAVAQATPLYCMNCFKFPKGFIYELNM